MFVIRKKYFNVYLLFTEKWKTTQPQRPWGFFGINWNGDSITTNPTVVFLLKHLKQKNNIFGFLTVNRDFLDFQYNPRN